MAQNWSLLKQFHHLLSSESYTYIDDCSEFEMDHSQITLATDIARNYFHFFVKGDHVKREKMEINLVHISISLCGLELARVKFRFLPFSIDYYKSQIFSE